MFAYAAGSLVLAAGVIAVLNKNEQSSLKEAQRLPATLPPAVQRGAASAVKVRYNYDLSIGGEGSGVKIGPDLVLTAGHVVLSGNPHNQLECAGSYTLNKYTTSRDWADQVINRKAIDNSSNDSVGQDMAVLRVKRDAAFDRLPTARIAANQPTKGETVFFVNYEVAGPRSRIDRYPRAGLADPIALITGAYDYPAEYAGTITGYQGPYLTVATSEAGYGPQAGKETKSRDGGSGGPVFNEAGTLIGEMVASYYNSESVSEISSEQGVKLQSEPSPMRQITIVQPITKALLQPLLAGLPKSPAC